MKIQTMAELDALRESKGISIKNLSMAVGSDDASYYRWKNKENVPLHKFNEMIRALRKAKNGVITT